MSKKKRIDVKPYLVAILSVFVATVLTQLLYPVLSSISFSLFYGGVAVTSWYGGRKSGLLAIALSTMAFAYFFPAPINYLIISGFGDILRLLISILVALLINYLFAELKTAQHQIEQLSYQQLQESEEKFRRAVLDSPMPIMLHAEDGEVILVNQTWIDITGYTQAEIPTIADWTEKAYGERKETIRAGIERLYSLDRRIAEGEYTIATKTGERRVWEFCSAPLGRLADGRRLAISSALDITDRKLAEAAWHQSDRLLALAIEQERDREILQEQARLLDLAHDTIITRDLNGTIAFWNHGAERMYGFAKSEALGKQTHLLLQTEFPQDLAEIEAKLIQQGYWEGELIHTRKDGIAIVVATRWALQKDDDDRPIKILEIHNDITAKKEAESALIESENNLNQAQRVAHIGSWKHNFATNTTIWTRELYRICGRDFNLPPAPIDEILNNIIYPEDREIYLQEIVEKIKIGQPFEADLRMVRTDGEIRYIEARGEPIFNQQGELISLMGSVLDITDRKQAEATLQEANRRWRSLLDNVQLMVVGLDCMGDVDYVNPFFLKVSGYELTEVMGKNWFKNFIPPSHRQEINLVFHEVLKHNFHPYYQNPILTKSGEERFIAWNNTLLQDLKGNIIGTISIGEDITQRQIVERMKNEFISIVSHELRTPLTAIHGSLGLLATGIYDNKPEKERRMLQIAVADSERLVRLVNDILDLERLDSGRVNLLKETCDALALMQRSVEGVQAIADRQAITLFVVPVAVKVWAAPDAIVQTLTNLLSNAIKFSPPNRTISLSAQIQSDFVLFQVKDQGRGIPADKLETIFERFQQVDLSDSRQKGGSGLGLAICQSIIHQHGGRIWVESTFGEGSTFYFTLARSGENLENDQQTNFSS